MVTADTYSMFLMFYSYEKSISRKNSVLLIEKFPSLVLPWDTIMSQNLIIQIPLYYLSRGRLRKVKNKRKFETFSSRSGRLKEVPNIVIWLGNFWYFGKLVAEDRRREARLYVGYVIMPRVKYLKSLLFRSRSCYSTVPPFECFLLKNWFSFQLLYVISYNWLSGQ